mmetsp:Transcript_101589/g.196482  ORF Transcript_101589/g.196482 Transcript_101589/m.196482 type:complete len:220 (+) Transcript_101589:33-692(+)
MAVPGTQPHTVVRKNPFATGKLEEVSVPKTSAPPAHAGSGADAPAAQVPPARPPQTRVELAPPGTRFDVAARNGTPLAGSGNCSGNPLAGALSTADPTHWRQIQGASSGTHGPASRDLKGVPEEVEGDEERAVDDEGQHVEQAQTGASVGGWLARLVGYDPVGDVGAEAFASQEAAERAEELKQQLVAVGFTETQASEASKRTSTVEAGVEWIVNSGTK